MRSIITKKQYLIDFQEKLNFQEQVWRQVWILETMTKNRCAKEMFLSKKGSGFGEL